MTTRTVRLEELVNRKVVDADGTHLGRLEEMRSEVAIEGDRAQYVVREFHVGRYAIAEALAGGMFARALLRLVGGRAGYQRFVIPWEEMDLSDPGRPRVRRKRGEIEERR